jgi:signal transduction histidine kinase
MKSKQEFAEQKSRVRRLGVMYVVSLVTITVLTVASHSFVLRELVWQSDSLRSIANSALRPSLKRPLGVSATAFLAAAEPARRIKPLEALREAIDGRARGEGDVPAPRAGGEPKLATASESESARLWQRAEQHRRAASEAAAELLSKFTPDGSRLDGDADIAPLVDRINREEEEARQGTLAAVIQAERETVAHLGKFKTTGTILFSFVMMVLLLEGYYVIRPALQKIQLYMAEMSRSHAEMKTYAARLEQSNKELQDFASVASHDLQEPLRKVQAFSDRLRTKCAASLDEQGRDFLERIQNAARRMQTLIDDLLSYSRVTTKAQPFVPVDLGAATRAVISDLEVRIEQAKGRVELGGMMSLDADPLQVRQLMQNLIGNALKYHRPEEPPVVQVSSKILRKDPAEAPNGPSREFCQVVVEDNGIGFDEVYSERIFSIFQRLHGRNEYEGTGIGLAICRKIAERHGGTIAARSTPGKGSTFTVTLPVRQEKETASDGITR